MARIPDEEIERLKQEVSLQRLVEEKGIVLRRHGADLLGLCPFHDDKEPSLVVTPANNLWHCLGACRAGGSVIDWVMRSEGVSFRHAVEILRNGAALTPGPAPKKASVKKLSSPLDASVADKELLRRVVDYYHQTLLESPEALSYLEERAMRSSELIESFKLGFSNRTLGYRLPMKNRADGASIRGRLIELGIYRDSGHEHFNGSIVFPIFDDKGDVAEIYARKITRGLRKGTPLHLYLPGPHRGVWNLEALQSSPEVILCESLIDAATFWAGGFRNVTASYGVEGFTKDHEEAFARYAIKRVLIAYDRDDAGNRAAEDLSNLLNEAGIECFRIGFPYGQDANDVARSSHSPTEALGRFIRSATWEGKGNQTNHRAPTIQATNETTPVLPLAAEKTSPVPAFTSPEIPMQIKGDEVTIILGDRRWRVRGIARNSSFDLLRVNLLVSHLDKAISGDFHVDTLDLYSARARASFLKTASEELRIEEEILKADLAKVLLSCEAVAEELINKALQPKEPEITLTEDERAEATKLLKDPLLVNRILEDFERAGVVGEETNKLLGYLASVSRKLEEPLAVVFQSQSAAGKSSLMEAVLSFVPEEEKLRFSAMTGQSLFYMQDKDLSAKVLSIAEEEGAQRASYALKLLQSEGELSIASTGKDPHSGRLVTHEYRVKGPVAILLTTTSAELDEELLSRSILLSVDEERDQTRAIHRLQRERQTLEGLLETKERQRVIKIHQDAQRLLTPILVANPYARWLTFADERTRMRRDHLKYLTLIRTIALLHQHQREKKSILHDGEELAYIEATIDDIRLANRLAHEVLGRSLDELSPQTRKLLGLLDAFVTETTERHKINRADFRFNKKDVRDHTGWSEKQVRTHLEKLVELEYLLVHRGGRGQSFVFELLYDGQGKDGSPFVIGLADPETLQRHIYDKNPAHRNGEFDPSLPIQRPPNAHGLPNAQNGTRSAKTASKLRISSKNTSRERDQQVVVPN